MAYIYVQMIEHPFRVTLKSYPLHFTKTSSVRNLCVIVVSLQGVSNLWLNICHPACRENKQIIRRIIETRIIGAVLDSIQIFHI